MPAESYGGGYTVQEIIGNRESHTSTGNVTANVTTGANFLQDLLQKAGGNEALTGTAYLGQNSVLGRSPNQLTGGFQTRYNQYVKLLGAFSTFLTCVQGGLNQ